MLFLSKMDVRTPFMMSYETRSTRGRSIISDTAILMLDEILDLTADFFFNFYNQLFFFCVS